jgi:hypothetical protein
MFRIVGQILVKGGLAVQSDRFSETYCLGNFKNAIKSLERLEPDEINIIDIDGNLSSTLEKNLSSLKKIGIPVSVGGGVDLDEIHNFPVERYLINSLLFQERLSSKCENFKQGRQSLIGYLPFRAVGDEFQFFDSTSGEFVHLDENHFEKVFHFCSEVVFLDADNQGFLGSFNRHFLDHIPREYLMRSYLSGGIFVDNLSPFRDLDCAGVVLDNSSLYWQRKIYRR